MPKTSHTSYIRSYGGYGKAATPGVLGSFIHLKVDCGLATKQIVGILPRHNRILAVYRVGLPGIGAPGYVAGAAEAAAGTFQMDLEAVTNPTLSLVNVVAAGATAAVGAKTVVAASLLLPFVKERPISVTWSSGVAGQIAWLIAQVIAQDSGREGS